MPLRPRDVHLLPPQARAPVLIGRRRGHSRVHMPGPLVTGLLVSAAAVATNIAGVAIITAMENPSDYMEAFLHNGKTAAVAEPFFVLPPAYALLHLQQNHLLP